MSIYVTSAGRLVELCQQTLAVHNARGGHGVDGEKIARLFRAIHVAQNTAYAIEYDEDLDEPRVEFPSTAPAALMVNKPDLRGLYDELRMLRYNTVDQHGNRWLPDQLDALLAELITQTAAIAAGFHLTR